MVYNAQLPSTQTSNTRKSQVCLTTIILDCHQSVLRSSCSNDRLYLASLYQLQDHIFGTGSVRFQSIQRCLSCIVSVGGEIPAAALPGQFGCCSFAGLASRFTVWRWCPARTIHLASLVLAASVTLLPGVHCGRSTKPERLACGTGRHICIP